MPHLARRLARSSLMLWVFALALGTMLASAGPPGAAVAQGISEKGVAFPESIEGFVRGQRVDYDPKEPGFGFSYGYNAPGSFATVYVYDLRLRNIPSSADAPLIQRQRDQAVSDVLEATKQGLYQSSTVKRKYLLRGPGGRPAYSAAEFSLVREGRSYDSFVYVTGWKGNFLKIRYSTLTHQASARDADRFALSFLPSAAK